MEESSFQFTEPKIEAISFEINPKFKPTNESIEVNSELGLKIEHGKNINDDNMDASKVTLNFNIAESDNMPFSISIKISSLFFWEKNSYDENTLKALLSKNASALLISYLRPIVASITNWSGNYPYHIPFINFSNLKLENEE